MALYNDEDIDNSLKTQASLIAIRNSFKLGDIESATKLIADIPPEEFDISLALQAIKEREEAKDLNGAFTIAKQVLQSQSNEKILDRAIALANQLKRMEDLQELLNSRK